MSLLKKKERRANTALFKSINHNLEIGDCRIALGQATIIVTDF